MKKVTVTTYRKDKYYPRVVRAVAKILSNYDVVAPVDVLIEMGNLNKKNHDAWRQGKVPYLERVIEGSLSKANRILGIIGFHAHDLNMVPNITQYHRKVNGRNHQLQFSKSGNKKMEEAYSKHYHWNQSPEKKQEIIEREMPEQMRWADGVKIAVLSKGRASSEFTWTAAHAHEPQAKLIE